MTDTVAPEPSNVEPLNFERCYRAIASRDARFDGQFYTAVSTTGIYCRPSCPAQTPKRENVSFHTTSAAAQQAGCRACRRCLPDATPGSPRWNLDSTLAARAMRLIADGLVDRSGVTGLAHQLGYSTRHLTRVLTSELGAGPLALARAHRADTARILIQSTNLPLSDVAFAAGFTSIRQFNSTIRAVYSRSPSELRTPVGAVQVPGEINLRLPVRAPYAADAMLDYLGSHSVPGLEHSSGTQFTRTLKLPHGAGTATVDLAAAANGYIRTRLTLDQARDAATAVARLRHLLDLDSDPVAIDRALGADPDLAPLVRSNPGIRTPGCIDAQELLIRAMIGRQVSVRSARAQTAKLVESLGCAIGDRVVGGRVAAIFPDCETIAESGHLVLTGPASRIDSIRNAAEQMCTGKLHLHGGLTATECREMLLNLPGVGPWTADYVTMRLLRDPDTLLSTDLALRRAAKRHGIQLDRTRWRPWSSYAMAYLMNTRTVSSRAAAVPR